MKKLDLIACGLMLYVLSFIAIERLGVFSNAIPPLRGIVMFPIVLIAASGSTVLFLVSAVLNRSSMSLSRRLGMLAVVLIVVGLWSSRFSDFAIDVVLTEGQVYETDAHRSVGLLYAGLFSPVPKFRLFTEKVGLDGEGGGAAGKAAARTRLLLQVPGGAQPEPLELFEGRPRLQNGMFLTVKSHGYSLRYAVKKSGRVLESDFISLRLLPSGSEDYFRLLTPHTFYVRYYPGHQENGTDRPLKVKIARNKDIVFNGYAALNQDIPFEDAVISFEEMRRWAQVSIRRPWGEVFSWAGLALAFANLSFMLFGSLRSSRSQ